MRKHALLIFVFGVFCAAGVVYLFSPKESAPPLMPERAGSGTSRPPGSATEVHPPGAIDGAAGRTGASLNAPGDASTQKTAPAVESPTGNPELDEVYRTNPAWAKRWDAYKIAFVQAQSAHRQPPAPPEHPDIDKERFRISRPPPGFPQ